MFCSFLYRLDQALAQYFGEAAEIPEQDEVYPATPLSVRKCPQCNSDMVLKTRKNGGLVTFPLVASCVGLCFSRHSFTTFGKSLETLGCRLLTPPAT